MGLLGENPFSKLDNQTQKFNGTQLTFNDNFMLGLGTAKTTTHIPGYCGFIPTNQQDSKIIKVDPITQYPKTNHSLNYNLRLPGYSGYKPTNSVNIKGEPRPYCLSVKDEKFN